MTCSCRWPRSLGHQLIDHRRDRAAAPVGRRGRPGRRRRPDRPVPVRPARTRLRARRHLGGGPGRLPAPAARGGQPGRHRLGRRSVRQPDAGPVPGRLRAGPGAAGRGRRGRVPDQSGLGDDRRRAARAALPADRRDTAQADPLAAVRHDGARSACGSRCSCCGSWPTRTARPPTWRPDCCPRWPWPPRWGRCSGLCSTPGYSVSTSPRGARLVHRVLRVSIGVVSPSWRSWLAC